MKKERKAITKPNPILRHATTLAFLLFATVGSVISTFFVSISTFPQSDQILINEVSRSLSENQIALAQLQNIRAKEETKILPPYWKSFVNTYNKHLGYDSALFKIIGNQFSASTNDIEISNDIVISDITTNFYNSTFSSNNIVFLTSDNMNNFDDQSIIIEKKSADLIISSSLSDGINNYADLYNYPIIIENDSIQETYFVSGVYDGTRQIVKRNFNGLFSEFGETYFISIDAAAKYGPGKIYATFSNDIEINNSSFELLRKLFNDYNLFLQFPDMQINSFLINDVHLFNLRESILTEYHKTSHVLLTILMWIIMFSFVFIVADVFCEIQKQFFPFFTKKNMGVYSIIVPYALYLLFFFVGLIIQVVFLTNYNLFGYIVYSVFPASVMFQICSLIVVSLLVLSSSYKNMLYLKVAGLSFYDVNELSKEMKTINHEVVTLDIDHEYSANALIIGGLALPSESAGANRIKASVRILNDSGLKCYALGHYPGEIGEIVTYEPGYDIIPYYNSSSKSKFKKIQALLFPRKTIRQIIENLVKSGNEIKLIYIYSALPIGATIFLKRYAKKKNITLVFDVVEFQVFSQQNFKTFFTYYLSNQIINKLIIRKGDQVISISSFLDKYFAKRKIETFVLPYVNDSNTLPYVVDNKIYKKTEKRIFFYAGNPFGRRDLIAEMVRGFLSLNEETKKSLIVIFAGISPEQVLSESLSYDELVKASSFISFLGKIPHEQVRNLYKIADYTMLLKPENKRLSHAGFPTKIAESWGFGIPVIANISSDLKKYLIDGENGFVSESSKPEDFKKAVERAMEIDDFQLKQMRISSRKTSEEQLDYRLYSQGLVKYLRLKRKK